MDLMASPSSAETLHNNILDAPEYLESRAGLEDSAYNPTAPPDSNSPGLNSITFRGKTFNLSKQNFWLLIVVAVVFVLLVASKS